MKEEVKKIWIDALTSGEYKQGMGKLKSGDQFCCLGVLCDLYKRETGNADWDEDMFLESDSYLPSDVIEWAGLRSYNPQCLYADGSGDSYLGNENDNKVPFKEIAELIKEYF